MKEEEKRVQESSAVDLIVDDNIMQQILFI